MEVKLYSMKDVGYNVEAGEMDSILHDLSLHPNDCMHIVLEAQQYWWNLEDFRKERQRCYDYAMGEQWKDMIETEDGPMTEEDYLKINGNVPLKNNLIWRTIRNVVGVYRSQDKEPTVTARDREEQTLGETMSILLQYVNQLNKSKKLNAKMFIEYLISAMVVCRKRYGWGEKKKQQDCWTKYVDPSRFFFDPGMESPTGDDVSCVGMIHDMTFNRLCGKFAHSPEDYEKLAHIYARAKDVKFVGNTMMRFGESKHIKHLDFLVPADQNMCRVIEVWKRELKPRYHVYDLNGGVNFKIDEKDYDAMVTQVNMKRLKEAERIGMPLDQVCLRICNKKRDWFMDDYWYFRFLTPTGEVLQEGETPYEHGEHPFVFSLYPFLNGRVHSLVADVIDQQRYINRLITLYDWVMRARTKESSFFPEECLPDDMTLEDLKADYAKIGNLILIKKGANKLPTPIQSAASNFDINTLLNIQLKMFEDVSGVNGALQGKPGYSQTSGVLYQQQTQNATTSLLDILEDFSDFIVEGAYKDISNMQQFYEDGKVAKVAGRNGKLVHYDKGKMQNVVFDCSITESTSTPIYRLFANQTLEKLVELNQITARQMLQFGYYPFADELLQSMDADAERMNNGEQMQGVSPDLMEKVQAGSNQNDVNRLYKALMQNAEPEYVAA